MCLRGVTESTGRRYQASSVAKDLNTNSRLKRKAKGKSMVLFQKKKLVEDRILVCTMQYLVA